MSDPSIPQPQSTDRPRAGRRPGGTNLLAALRRGFSWSLLGVLLLQLLGLGAFWFGLSRPVEQVVKVGEYGDWNVLRGWYSAEIGEASSWRWSADEAELHFAAQGSGMALLRLQLQSPPEAGIPAQVQLTPVGETALSFQVGPRAQVYTLLLPLPEDGGGLRLELQSTTYPAADGRDLGVAASGGTLVGPLEGGVPFYLLLRALLGALAVSLVALAVWPRSGFQATFSVAWLVGPSLLAGLGLLAWWRGETFRALALEIARWLPLAGLALVAITVWLGQRMGRERARFWLILGLALVVAAALRFWGLNWDGGYLFHPDEWVLDNAAMQLQPPWHPGFFAYGSLPLYLYRASAAFLAYWHDPGWLQDLGRFALIGRAYAALASTATVVLVALLARRAGYRRSAGLWAALFLVGAVLAVQNAHYGTTDSLLTLEVTLLAYFCVRYLQQGRWPAALAAGIVTGLALATKITAITFIALPGAALLLRLVRMRGAVSAVDGEGGRSAGSRERSGDFWQRVLFIDRIGTIARDAGLILLSAGLACFAAAPYYLLDWPGLLRTLGVERSDATSGMADYTYQFIGSRPYLYQLRNALFTLGPALLFLALAGWLFLLVRGVRRRSRVDLLLVSWPTLYFALMGAFFTKYVRYMLPLLPFLCLFAGILLGELIREGQGRWSCWRRWLGWSLGVGGVLFTLGYALLFARGVYGRPDPRLAASLWVYQQVPAGSRILREEHDVKLPVPLEEPDNPLALRYNPYIYELDTLALYTPGLMESPAYYDEALGRADYLLVPSRSQHVTFRRFPERFPVRACLYEKLFDGSLGYTLLRRFTRGPGLGPWRIDGEHDPQIEETFQVFDHPTVLLFARTGPAVDIEGELEECR